MNFPKAVVSNGPHNGADALPPDLHFHNAQLFPVAAEDHHHHHSNEQRKSPTFLPLDSDFLMPVTKSYTTADGVGNVEVGGDKVVQELLLNGTGVSMDVSLLKGITNRCFAYLSNRLFCRMVPLSMMTVTYHVLIHAKCCPTKNVYPAN